ncbi:MAG: hypothetical protein JWQ42_4448 [Edaphobacter sp.]|nr:hypothetical protein [Edaphobacter sp.]
MGRNTAPRHIKNMRRESAKPKPQKAEQLAPLGPVQNYLNPWKIISTLALLSSLWISFAWFLPELSAEPSAQVYPSDPFSSPFVIKNEGNFSLDDVNGSCHIERMELQGNSNVSNGDAFNYMTPVRSLASREPTTIFCRSAVETNIPILSGDISLRVTYSPSICPFIKRTKIFRFTTISQPNKSLRWTPRAVEDTNK